MKRKKRYSESGQATAELAVMMVGLVAVTLGLIFTAGLCLANNRTLLSAKIAAERAARRDGAPAVGNIEMTGWTYGSVKLGPNESALIPFTQQDTPGYDQGNSIDSAYHFANNSSYSESGRYDYEWMSPRRFDSSRFQSDYTSSLGNAIEAASLVRGTGEGGRPVSHFDRGYGNNVSKEMRDAFYYWFGVRIKDDTIAENPTNQVYMPLAGEYL